MALDERGLAERLRELCGPGRPMTFEQASLAMGQSGNAVSRWTTRDLPGPEKYASIAAFLGISVFEVGGAIAIDAVRRHEERLSR